MKKSVASKPVRGRPPAFMREQIVDCAVQLLERDGVDRLTLRGVARELGVVLGTLNSYFRTIAELEDAVAARLLQRMPVIDVASTVSMRDQLVELGMALISIHSIHPYLRHVVGPNSAEVGVARLQQSRKALESMGLSEMAAMLCTHHVQSIAFGAGTELHRVRKSGADALRLYEEVGSKLTKGVMPKRPAKSYTAENLQHSNREMLRLSIDIFLRGCAAGKRVR